MLKTEYLGDVRLHEIREACALVAKGEKVIISYDIWSFENTFTEVQ